jgi:hypothetical protein
MAAQHFIESVRIDVELEGDPAAKADPCPNSYRFARGKVPKMQRLRPIGSDMDIARSIAMECDFAQIVMRFEVQTLRDVQAGI